MSFEFSEPILIVGIGGAGSKLAKQATKSLNAHCLIVSNDQKDLSSDCPSIHVSTKPIINPTVSLIRGATTQSESEIMAEVSKYSTVILFANLAGKSGSAMAPIISQLSKEANKNVFSFAIMPFKYEKDRIFNSGIALKRLSANSHCTIVVDNDGLLQSNPNIVLDDCYEITNSAMLHVVDSLKQSSISKETLLLTTGKTETDLETSLKDSMKMLYENMPPNSVKHSILYVIGGNNASVGMLNSIADISSSVLNEQGAQIEMSTISSEESRVVMLSTVQGETKFDKYDPLGMIPKENQLDWDDPECSINCNFDLYQLE